MASSTLSSFGAKPPSSPTAVLKALFLQHGFERVKISVMARKPSLNVGKPFGMIMNSWKSIGASECAPPLMTLAIGTGSTFALGPPRYLNSGMPMRFGGGFGVRERDGEDGVRAELGFGFRAVEIEHDAVDGQLVQRVDADRARAGFCR